MLPADRKSRYHVIQSRTNRYLQDAGGEVTEQKNKDNDSQLHSIIGGVKVHCRKRKHTDSINGVFHDTNCKVNVSAMDDYVIFMIRLLS